MIGRLLCALIGFYNFVLIGRVVVGFIPLFKPDWAPPEPLRPIIGFIYSITDPPVNFLRRFIPSIGGGGGVAIDLAFLAWWLAYAYLIAPTLCRLAIVVTGGI